MIKNKSHERTPRVTFPVPFRMGDVVEEIAPRGFGASSEKDYLQRRRAEWEKTGKGRRHVICGVKMRNEGYLDYSTDHGAWYPHSSFKLVEESNQKTLNQILRDQRIETEEDYEE